MQGSSITNDTRENVKSTWKVAKPKLDNEQKNLYYTLSHFIPFNLNALFHLTKFKLNIFSIGLKRTVFYT
jgi:hypothetical protein